MLTPLQTVTLDKLREHKCQWLARTAQEAWSSHERIYMDDRVKCPRWLRRLFDEANGKTTESRERGQVLTQLELLDWRPPKRRSRKRRSASEWKIVAVRETTPDKLAECNTPQQAVEYWHSHIATASHFNPDCECFAVLLLNVRKRIRGHHIVSIGSLCEATAQPREVFRAAVIGAAHSVVLMHNHPSGDPQPSEADIRMTKRLMESGHILCVEVTDHIVVGHRSHCSFREAGLI